MRFRTFSTIYTVKTYLPVDMRPSKVFCQEFYALLYWVSFVQNLYRRVSQGNKKNQFSIHVKLTFGFVEVFYKVGKLRPVFAVFYIHFRLECRDRW